MHERGKSDSPVVPANLPNNAAAAEAGEGSGLAKGNTASKTRPGHWAGHGALSALDRVRQAARRDKEARFTALLHHVSLERLVMAYWALSPKAAPGVDGVTWQDYGRDLVANLRDLHDRVHSGRYRARPSRRAYIPKADGRLRPLGITALEDKIVQRAVVEVLNAVYEADFRGFSYGFRPGRGPHDALDALATGIERRKVNWILDADIRDFFTSLDHCWLEKFLGHRIADGRMLRLLRKWLKAGVIEDGKWSQTPEGAPQGASASPLMAMSPKDRARHEDRLRDYHADLPLVNTPTIQKVISTGRLLIQLNRRQISARRGMVISGMSGTGKTTALTQLGRAHELAIRRRFPDDGDRLPVIYVTVPPAATPRMLAVEFARFLGLEFPARANVTDITDAVCSVAAHTRVDLVLVDEIHNISLATRAGAEVSDQLKYFAERLPATFIYAGVEVEAQGLFAGARGRQIAGRFTVVAAVPFAYGTAEQSANWHALVAAVESTLRLRDHVAGTLPEMAEQLYRRSRGMIGSLSQLVRGAAILAIDDGTEKITAELLDLVPVDYAAQRCDNPIRASRLVGDTTAL